MVHVWIDTKIDEQFLATLQTDIDMNEFKNNNHMQIVAIDIRFYGSLIQFTSTIPRSQISISRNFAEYNKFIGIETALISLDGGVWNITENEFYYNGYLTEKFNSGHPASVVDLEGNTVNIPFSEYGY